MNYILVDSEPVPEPDVLAWAEWFQNADRTIASTEIKGVRVSTVFLGVDHNWGNDPPLLFETMVFGGRYSKREYCQRYPTLEAAMAGHEHAVGVVDRGEDTPDWARQGLGALLEWLFGRSEEDQ